MLDELRKLFQPVRLLTETLSIYLAFVGMPETSFSFLVNLFSIEISYFTETLLDPQLTSISRELSFIVITSSNKIMIFSYFLES
jgi:hypothetical protein